jgi:hypothetical protein
MIPLLGLQTCDVYRATTWGVGTDGYLQETRVKGSEKLVIDTMSQGQFSRSQGQDTEWTGGAIQITSYTPVLAPVDDQTGKPADWVKYRGRVYQVITVSPTDDPDFPDLECVSYVASLLRPQPVTLPD